MTQRGNSVTANSVKEFSENLKMAICIIMLLQQFLSQFLFRYCPEKRCIFLQHIIIDNFKLVRCLFIISIFYQSKYSGYQPGKHFNHAKDVIFLIHGVGILFFKYRKNGTTAILLK